MRSKNLFDFDYSIQLPPQSEFPLNISQLAHTVKDVLIGDITSASEYTIITGFTSLANLIDIFGSADYPNLQKLEVVIGYDPDERVGKRLPHYNLATEVKNFWLKQNVSIRLCAPIINILQQIDAGRFDFKAWDKLHAKLYVSNQAAVLGSSNFSKSGIIYQSEANIRVQKNGSETERKQYNSIKDIASYFYTNADDYNQTFKELLFKLFKDATWEEAVARAIAEILESKWMKDYPALYNALINNKLWPSQRIGIASAMRIIQERGRVLIADPTGSGKTKLATALACTVFHWLWENGLRDHSNALIISPKQVIDGWEREQTAFNNLYNKIESMGRLSLSNEKIQKQLQKEIRDVDILVVDEAHNYLRRGSIRSKAINPKGSTHVLLSTATPINKKPEDLLRLIELLDIDNLSNEDLATYLELRKKRRKGFSDNELDMLKSYINKFIVRRTKRELNQMIDREKEEYKNDLRHYCRYPEMITDSYLSGETAADRQIVQEIKKLTAQLKGINYLKRIKIPDHYKKLDDKKRYVSLRLTSGPALSAFMIHSSLRSSCCAIYEHLYGTKAAIRYYELEEDKGKNSGNMIETLRKIMDSLPVINFPEDWLPIDFRWLVNKELYTTACLDEIELLEQIGKMVTKLSRQREIHKATMLIQKASEHHKILAFDSTVITLDYLKKLMIDLKCKPQILIATGQHQKNRDLVKQYFALESKNDEPLIALCSDAMSEGINLPSAQALILLDIPSVLRLIEQRIGRIERMDSEHAKVHVYWPEDSEEFSLKGDKRMLDILVVTDNLIGNNVEIPQKLYERYLKDSPSAENFMKAFHAYKEEEEEWTGVKDSTQSLYTLYEGKKALIDLQTYNTYKDIDASIKTAISFIETNANWSFFAFRGDSRRSPKWLFIDERNKGITDFSEISQLLKERLAKGKIIQRKWTEINTPEEIRKVMHRLRSQEYGLLSEKKKRALTVAKNLIGKKIETEKADRVMTGKLRKLAAFLKNDHDGSAEDYIDYNHFADLWLQILIPELDHLRNTKRIKTKIFTLNDLMKIDISLPREKVDWLLDNSQYANTLDEIIASCIIAVQS